MNNRDAHEYSKYTAGANSSGRTHWDASAHAGRCVASASSFQLTEPSCPETFARIPRPRPVLPDHCNPKRAVPAARSPLSHRSLHPRGATLSPTRARSPAPPGDDPRTPSPGPPPANAPTPSTVHPAPRKAPLSPQQDAVTDVSPSAGSGARRHPRRPVPTGRYQPPRGPRLPAENFRTSPSSGRAPPSRDPRPRLPPARPRPGPAPPGPTSTREPSGRAPARDRPGRGRGRSPVRSSCLTVRSCSPAAPPSPLVPAAPPPPLPLSSSIFSLSGPADFSEGTRQTAGARPRATPSAVPGAGARRLPNSDAQRSLFPALAARLAPPPPPPPAGTARTAQPSRPGLPRLLPPAAPPTATEGAEPCEPPALTGPQARASLGGGSHWAARCDASAPAPPRSSDCCCLAGRRQRQERDYSDWCDPRVCPAHFPRCARAVRTLPSLL